jgi:hypothetical protein
LEQAETLDTKNQFALQLLALLQHRPELAQQIAARVTPIAQTMIDSAMGSVRLSGARLLQTVGAPFDRAPFFALLARYDAEGYDSEDGDWPAGVLRLLASSDEPIPVARLLATLRHTSPQARTLALGLIMERPEAAQSGVIEQLTPLLGDDGQEGSMRNGVADSAYSALRQLAPEDAAVAIATAQTLFSGSRAPNGRLPDFFAQAAEGEFARAMAGFHHLTPLLFDWIAQALASPFWRVRCAAVQIFHWGHQRNVPDAVIRQLYALRHDPDSPHIRNSAETALASILSLETGIEDDIANE